MEQSKISWTDFSGGCLNFVLRGKSRGDCEVSIGCANCYAFRLRNRNPEAAADHTTFSHDKLNKLSKWKPKGDFRRGPGSKPMAFVVDMGDLFHHLVPDEFIYEAFSVMAARGDIDFQVLTKRPERMAGIIRQVPENIWLGITAENQAAADKRLPFLKSIAARIRFLSVEPTLEPVHLDLDGIHWVICGGESGDNRRRFDKQWALNLRQQCAAAGAAFFFKQGSAYHQGQDDLLEGVSVKAWPR